MGRHAEWRALVSRWKRVCAGHAHLVVIGGEAGIGKTRLAEELIGYAKAQGAHTAQAHTYAASELAYAPLVAWLRAPALHERARASARYRPD